MARSMGTAERTARTAGRTARGAAQSPAAETLARLGYVVKGVVYSIIGFLAARSAIGDGGMTTDKNGALKTIVDQPFGKLLIGIVAVGLIAYALWCFARAIFDLDHKGSDAKGSGARVVYAIVGFSYAALAVVAVRLLMGSGSTGKSSDANAQDWTATLLKQSFGEPLLIVIGLLVIVAALVLFGRAYSASFLKEFQGMSGEERRWVERFGRAGHAALGVVFAEVGIFLIVAAYRHNAHEAVGLGGSLRQLVREPYGHFLLAIVAIGLICYGLYSLGQARFRRIATA